jgi:type II secretory pathway pseudopilin PulG
MHIHRTDQKVQTRRQEMPLVLHRRKDTRAGSVGFTLMELMIVIFMTAVLASLLLPALSTAKERSLRAVCKGNEHQILVALHNYADDNADAFPSAADNKGYYHSIRLSDQTYSNLLDELSGNSNILYCPNIVFGGNSNSVARHDAYGYVIGYSYLANAIQPASKGSGYWVAPTKATDSSTNELIADANYWTTSASSFPALMKVAPHGAMGPAMAHSSSFTVGLSGANSAAVGAIGGNIGSLDWSVRWRSITQMGTYTASSESDGYGNW